MASDIERRYLVMLKGNRLDGSGEIRAYKTFDKAEKATIKAIDEDKFEEVSLVITDLSQAGVSLNYLGSAELIRQDDEYVPLKDRKGKNKKSNNKRSK